MNEQNFYVVKRSAGYACYTEHTEQRARETAALCCNNNHNNDYMVCIYQCGAMKEI